MAPNYALSKNDRPGTTENPSKPVKHVECGKVLSPVGDGRFHCVVCLQIGYAFPAADHI